MREPRDGIDDEIRAELERISRDVIEWVDSEDPLAAPKPRWRPRHARERFAAIGKALVPLDRQVYHDLQLSRGASQAETPELAWEFEDPALGLTAHRPLNQQRLDHFLRHFPLAKDARLLELGMRSGHFLHFLLAAGYSRVTGIDCVKLNTLWCRKNGLDARHGDAHELAAHFEAGSMGAIFAYHVLEHCYDVERVLRGCWSVLEAGGGIHVEVPLAATDLEFAHCYRFARGDLGALLKAAGFEVLDCPQRGRGAADIELAVARKRG